MIKVKDIPKGAKHIITRNDFHINVGSIAWWETDRFLYGIRYPYHGWAIGDIWRIKKTPEARKEVFK